MQRDAAIKLIREKHYSKTHVQSSRIHLGVYAKAKLLGCLQFGVAMNPQSMASVVADTQFDEYLELNRMWLDDSLPRNSESRAISYAIKYIKHIEPRVAWIQSFADERCGRFGVVYQAANFVYCGEHVGRFWELDGKFYHDSLMSDSRKAKTPRGSYLRANRTRAVKRTLRQFRYIYFIKPKFRARLLHAEKPYPKS